MSSSTQELPPPTTVTPLQATRHARLVNGLLLVAILLAAAAVRFYALDASSLWNDEGSTWALMARSFPQIARDAAADIHPPGYYWLLKIWTSLAGNSAWAMRSLSALLGVALVFLVYRIGLYLETDGRQYQVTALLAALIAALNPFQVYYAQEARMYMLLAVASAGLFWSLFALVQREDEDSSVLTPLIGFVAFGALGLWTHYSFPVVLAAVGVAYVIDIARVGERGGSSRTRRLVRYAGANALVLLLYLPWLPTAIDRILHWPKGGEWVALVDGLVLTLQTLITGPIRTAPALGWPWLLLAVALPVAGLWAVRSQFAAPALGFWWLAPIGLMAALGLFSDAFLKFLLVASPAWALLVSAAPLVIGRGRVAGQAAVAIGAVVLAVLVLPAYYADPVARDNYAGVARYVAAAGDPAQDTVVIDAPGQRDVWSYYDPGVPTLPLPEQRPPDGAQTTGRLAAALDGQRHAYAILWATDESDPDSIVEEWLDQNAFRGMESWQGNMRFVVYSFAPELTCREPSPPIAFGSDITMTAECQPAYPQNVVAGDAATIALHWQTSAPLEVNYKISVQLLDERGQVIAQHDGEPAGGSRPTSTWTVGESVVDNHGLPIPPGTPPGDYELMVAVYDPGTAARLPVVDTDHARLGAVHVVRPAEPLPIEVVPIQYHVDRQLGPVRLGGYAAHARGMSHAPDTALRPGDVVHFSLLWQAPDPLPEQWPGDLEFALHLGSEQVVAPLAGGGYPSSDWQAGELVRGEFDITYSGEDAIPVLTVGEDSYKLKQLPVE